MSAHGYVHVHWWRHWASADGRREELVEWRPGMTVFDVVCHGDHGAPGFCVHVNNERETDRARRLSPHDHVDVSVRPADPITGITAALISAAVSTGIGLILSLILPRPKGPKNRGDQQSATYQWNGKENNRVEGQPRPVLYGELSFAPQVVDSFVRTQSVPPRSDLYVLLLLGPGPYQDIGGVDVDNPVDRPLKSSDHEYPLPLGIEIDGNDIRNLRGIEAHVRLGTDDQEPIPGFEEIHTVSQVGSTLTQAETTAQDNTALAWDLSVLPYNSNDASVQAIWTARAQAFTLPEEADAYTITVNFAGGLYRNDTSGLHDAIFQGIVRYKEVHYLGFTVDSGGDNGDGWVYAPPPPALVTHHQGSFSYEISGSFYSPSGYTQGVPGGILSATVNGAGAYTSASNGGVAANAVTPWATGTAIDAFTFECWYTPTSLPSTGTGVNACRPIFEWMSSGGTFAGISLVLQRITIDAGGDSPTDVWRSRVYWGDGTATLHTLDGSTSIFSPFAAGVRHHIAVTWSRNIAGHGGNDRWRVYLDGVVVREFIDSQPEMAAPLAPMRLLESLATPNGTVKGFGQMDEARVWRQERSASQISADYNAGSGNFVVNAPELVAGWHFDVQDNTVNFSFATDVSSNANSITTEGGATMGDPTTPGAVVVRPGTGNLKRARFLVQCMRLNVQSTSALLQDEATWVSIDGRVDEQLAYPNSVMLGLKIPATEQLNSTQPTVTVRSKGRKCPVWDRVSTTSPSFTRQWTANNAWVLYDAATDARFGAGSDFDFSKVNLTSFAEWADYCDDKLYDGLGRVNVHETDATQPIADLLYDSTLNDGAGGLQVQFRLGSVPPAHWVASRWIGFQDLPTSGGTIVVNVNIENVGGFLIQRVWFNGGAWLVDLVYPVAELGAPWADGTGIAAASGVAVVNGTAEGREERFRFDGVFDTFKRTWDAWQEICRAGRASPIIDGDVLRVRVSRPRLPVGIVGQANVKKGSFRVIYTSRRDRPNLYVSEILDRDQNWAQKPVQRTAATLAPGAPESAVVRDNIDLFGVTRRSHALRDMDFQLAVNDTLVRQVEYVAGIESLLYEVGDVMVVAPDLVPWGVSGRFPAACTGTTAAFERQVVLAPATTYFLMTTHGDAGQAGSGSSVSDYIETRQITSVAGTYAAGAAITITSAFTVDPKKFDTWTVYSDAERKLFEIVEIGLDDEYMRKVTAVQYDDSVYDVDLLTTDVPAPPDPPIDPSQAPLPVESLTITESQIQSGDGSWHERLNASWQLEATTAANVSYVLVWARVAGTGPFSVASNNAGPATSSTFAPPNEAVGTTIEIAIQPVASGGSRLDLPLCTHGTITLTGFFLPPETPTNLVATMDGDLVTYSWTQPDNDRGLFYEVRRGGWILGQVIGVTAPGETFVGPTDDWAASKNNARGDGPPVIIVRARDSRGQYSGPCALFGFNPSAPGSAVLTSSVVRGRVLNGADQRYEDWGTGWTDTFSVVTSPILVGVDVTTIVDGRKVLRLSGTNLVGTYTTGANTIASDSTADWTYVEAFVSVDQVPPLTLADITLPLDDPAAARRSLEGLIDAPQCTLLIEWAFRVASTDDYSAWQEYVPGRYFMLDAKFRITVTRPDTTWNVRMYSFGTRFSRTAPTKFQKSEATAHVQLSQSSMG